MIGALRYEWLRIRTVRSTYVLLLLCLVFTGLLAWAQANGLNADQRIYAASLASGAQLPPILLGIIGVFAFGHEYRFGMIRPTLTALPRRSVVAGAKVAVVLAVALVTALACMLVAYVVTDLVATSTEGLSLTGGQTGRVLIGTVVWTLLFTLVGVGVGLLLRNIPAAIAVLIVWPLIVENVIVGLLRIDALRSLRTIGDYLPFAAGSKLYLWPAPGDQGADFGSRVSALTGGVTFGLFAVALLALGWLLFERRDA